VERAGWAERVAAMVMALLVEVGASLLAEGAAKGMEAEAMEVEERAVVMVEVGEAAKVAAQAVVVMEAEAMAVGAMGLEAKVVVASVAGLEVEVTEAEEMVVVLMVGTWHVGHSRRSQCQACMSHQQSLLDRPGRCHCLQIHTSPCSP